MKIKKLKSQITSRFGQSLVEMMVAIGLSVIFLPALITGFVASREGKAQQGQRLEASSYLIEGVEAVRNIREKGWTSFAVNGTYHPEVSSGTWTLVSGEETIGALKRRIVISDVYRNTLAGPIVAQGSPGAVLDPSTKKVEVVMSWTFPNISSTTSTLYLTRHENVGRTETTVADFTPGTRSGTSIANSSGGEIVLAAGGTGNWCNPNLTINPVDLPKSGVANAVSAIEGKIFTATGENSSGVSYATVNISNTAPPSGSLDKTFDGYKTNGVFGESGYAYLATDTNAKEIVIINLNQTDPGNPNKYKEEGYFNAPGNGSGNTVYVVGTVGYMISGSTLYTFNLSSKNGDRGLPLGSLTLAGVGNKIMVVGDRAYVAINSTTNQLEIVNVSNPSNPTSVKRYSLDSQAAKDIFVNNSKDRAYIATAVSSTQREMFIVNIANESSPSVVSSFEANGMSPKGITVVTGNHAILVGTGGQEYQVIDIAHENAPTSCAGLNIDSGVNGVSSVLESDGDAYSYIITGDATAELKIIEGGSGDRYSTNGTFISYPFDPGYTSAFNRFSANISKPSQTQITIDLAVADQVSGSCTTGVTYTYMGSFTSSDGSTISGIIPSDDDGIGYENPGRCFRYRATLTSSDITQTPVLYDFTLIFSP